MEASGGVLVYDEPPPRCGGDRADGSGVRSAERLARYGLSASSGGGGSGGGGSVSRASSIVDRKRTVCQSARRCRMDPPSRQW